MTTANCQTCTAWTARSGYEPYCARSTRYGHVGCIKHSRPVLAQEHRGEVSIPVSGKKKGKRKR
jgi:hypothetical protein